MRSKFLLFLTYLFLLSSMRVSVAQVNQEILVDLSPVQGLELNKNLLFQYTVFSSYSTPQNVKLKGRIGIKGTSHVIEYLLNYTVFPGMNKISNGGGIPVFTFSSNELKELFEQYDKLPQGIVEYCVSIMFNQGHSEIPQGINSECTFFKNDDLFLINLIYPENNAEIHEYNPLLTWIVTSPYAHSLQYKLRLAELKEGQSNQVAMNRNYTIFEESNIRNTSLLYPFYARPLVANQPYVWTVDVYYKNILLGGSEIWKFTIIDDSTEYGMNITNSYIDIRQEKGIIDIYVANELKLKYNLQESKSDTLNISIYDSKGKEIKLAKEYAQFPIIYGDNRIIISFADKKLLNHLKTYKLVIKNLHQKEYFFNFKYVDEELIKIK